MTYNRRAPGVLSTSAKRMHEGLTKLVANNYQEFRIQTKTNYPQSKGYMSPRHVAKFPHSACLGPSACSNVVAAKGWLFYQTQSERSARQTTSCQACSCRNNSFGPMNYCLHEYFDENGPSVPPRSPNRPYSLSGEDFIIMPPHHLHPFLFYSSTRSPPLILLRIFGCSVSPSTPPS